MKISQLFRTVAIVFFTAGCARAGFVATFDGALTNGGAANFANQDAWTISDPTVDLSFIEIGSAFGTPGKAVGLGGFYAEPTGATVRLSTVVSETLAGSRFSADFALINRYAGDPGNFFPENDRFGFALSDSSGDLLNIDFNATSEENIRQVSVNGTLLTPNGITASDYNTPLWYSLGINFTANGSNLDYSLTLAGGSITYLGTLSGKAAATLSGIGIDYDVTGASAGSNFLVVDNISIPEPAVGLTSLLALGVLAVRRRRP